MNIRHTQVWEKFLRLAKARRRRALLTVSALWIVPLLVLNGGNGLSLAPLPVKAQQAATGVPASPTEQFPPGPSASVEGAASAAAPVEAAPDGASTDGAPPAPAAQPETIKPDALAWPSLDEALTTTGAVPPPGIDRGKTISSAASRQLSVPPYVWYHGCGPTSAAMVFAFWDGRGFEKLLPGDPTTQSDAVNQAIASDDHYNDYALPLDDLEHSATLLEDKSEDPLGDEHADNSIADFMKTSQSVHELRYGWSSSRFMADAYTNYVKSVAPEYATNVRFLTMEDGFSWEMYKGEIDGNRPVMLVVDTDGDGETDHAGVGIGYDDASGQMMAVYDTWDTEVHWYEFAKMDIGRQWGVYGGVLYDMGVFFQVNAPQDEPDKNPGDGICLTLSNTCTLRAAIMEANATSGHDVILLPQSTYTLTRTGQNENAASTGDLDITESVTIRGEGKDITVIDGSLLDTVFAVGDLLTATSAGVESAPLSAHALAGSFFVEFTGVTIRNGVGGIKTWGSGYLDLIESAVLENQGTGVWSSGTEVTIAQSVVSNNANPGNTGGVDVSGARLNVHASTIYGNSGAVGGLSTDSGLLITESTIADNTGSAGPGGLAAAGGGTLINSTVAQNSGSEAGGVAADDELVFINTTLSENYSSGPGGGILAKTANQVIFSNTLITGNSGTGAPDCSGTILSNGYNLIGNGSGCTLSAGPGDLIGANANLGSLAANGGGTLTYALLPGSAAIDSGNPLGCTDENADPLLHDQRFSLRPRDGSGKGTAICDIGSFEVQETPVTPYPTSTPLTAVPSVTPSVSPTTPVVTVTPSVTATITPTPTASSTPIGPSCYEAIVNGGFEKDEAWVLPVTKYQAGYDTVLAQEAVANYTTDEAHSGGRSMRTGIVDPAKNIYSYSSAWQQVSVPANATSAKLTFWMLPKSINGIDGYDVQLMLILDAGKREIERPVNVRLDTGSWTSYEFDLKKYAGKTFWVYFGTYNNGYTATMSMYTDDVSLWVCKP